MLKKGFNLVGYATSAMGLGEDLRTFAAMLDILQIPFSVVDLPTDVSGGIASEWKNQTQTVYATSIFFMSAIECLRLSKIRPELFSTPSRRIGYFLWELPDFPDEYAAAFDLVDHLWVPTQFVRDVFRQKTNKLILVLPLPVIQASPSGQNLRAKIHIPETAFVALYMLDAQSTLTRKNPQAVLRVFLKFAETHPDAFMILKISRWQGLKNVDFSWLKNHPRLRVIGHQVDPVTIADLYASADCYLSLHKSEGFGRTLVEALQHGLYVISSRFSGPADFLNDTNSLEVPWTAEDVLPNDYPFISRRSWWARPDEHKAVESLAQAFQLAKLGKNEAGRRDGASFEVALRARLYAPILRASLT